MKAYIIDTETTSADDTAEVIEAAWIDQETGEEYCERFHPVGPISFGAMAVHHIMLHDLSLCRDSAEFTPPDCMFFIGHNVDFDWRVIGSPDVKRICTLALSRYLWPETDSHKQGAMMYFLFGADAQEIVKGAHNALEDVRMCQMILHACVGELAQRGVCVDTWEAIWQASEVARVPTVMSFGKHKGAPIKEVPEDYIRWYLKQAEKDEYLVVAFEAVQRQRAADRERIMKAAREIKEARKKAGFTVLELATAAGIELAAMSDIETGLTEATPDQADAIGLTLQRGKA